MLIKQTTIHAGTRRTVLRAASAGGTTVTIDTIIYWVRSTGPGPTKDRVPMYFKGRWTRDCTDGMRGDVRARPVSLGPGAFTATYSPDDFETEAGDPVRW